MRFVTAFLMILLGFGWAESKLTINYANGTFDQYESAHIYFTGRWSSIETKTKLKKIAVKSL